MGDQTVRYDIWLPSRNHTNNRHNRWVRISHQSGITPLTACFQARFFYIKGKLEEQDIQRLRQLLLVDPVNESSSVSVLPALNPQPPVHFDHFIDVTFLPGVTDPVAENIIRAAHLLGIAGIEQAATGQRYWLQGDLSREMLDQLAIRVFSNPVIQRFEVDRSISPPFVAHEMANDRVDVIPVREADDDELLEISTLRRLALDLNEMRSIRDYYREEGRDATDAEIEMLAQTWSEHCIHKTFRASIRYTGPSGASAQSAPIEQHIPGLLKTYIRAATEEVNKPWIRSAFVDNAGIIAFDEHFDIAFKVETHNHPSAIEPFGGANTGVGGVVRDVLGVSARPIANTDILCFGPQNLPQDQLPAGALHPRRIADGVIHGVEDYGNKMGIPTVNGAVLYHRGYVANPLVFCGCLGILPHGSHPTGAKPGDLIVVLGGRTGRDGLRGATFSSMEMDGTTGTIAGSAVQIGNPIQEKTVQEVILRARDAQLYSAITDCGAGGLSSAVGEMAKETGAHVQLDSVPLKYPGLRPWEIWLSEAQERMVLAVPPENWEALAAIAAGQDVEATCIGTFNSSGRLTLLYGEKRVGDMAMDFLHEGIPTGHLEAIWEPQVRPTDVPELVNTSNVAESLMKLLAHPNIRSKEAIVRRYDHEVQAGTILKPFVGVANHGPGDAVVLVPLETGHTAYEEGSLRGVALSNGICPQFGELDPYAMAWAAIDEALRNAVAVGADPDQIAILDNFCWGNPKLPDRLGGLVRCLQGCHDAAVSYGVPFISGKDSLNNEYNEGGQRHAIPGTLLISAVGIVPDINKTVSVDLKESGNVIYLIGDTHNELGGSHYHAIHDRHDGAVPRPNPNGPQIMRRLHQAITEKLVRSCHDVSEGGLVVALAEMCIGGKHGADLELSGLISEEAMSLETFLFSESLSRFIIETDPEDQAALEKLFHDIPFTRIGAVNDTGQLHINAAQQQIKLDIAALEEAWRGAIAAPLEASLPSHERQGSFDVLDGAPVQGVRPRVLVMHASGTNRDREAAVACEVAGGDPEIVHINQLLQGERHLLDYHMLVIPGGFSYGDDLGAGVLWALDMQTQLQESVASFVASGRPVLGICNGFQTLVKAGLLPGAGFIEDGQRAVTLTYNDSEQFECRWIYMKPNENSNCLFIDGLDDLIYCPAAHGEGRIAVRDKRTLSLLQQDNLVALTYVNADGSPATYPGNPNGSVCGIAGLTNRAGNVLGLMPHPEDHIFAWQHPRWHRQESGMLGLKVFKNGIRFA